MSDTEVKAALPNDRPCCDHICLLDDGHVERGERHFYGYQIPSPRRLAAEADRLRADLDEAVRLLEALVGMEAANQAALADSDEWWLSGALVSDVRAFLASIKENQP